ncbi:4-hydroxy-tetrahydrodipicolinate reductase [Candidatus Tokpelaia sp.]|uniref:4-hydroxy-tetrahydrodipicolinate reductase n=1 Tax=Candidatus Tokpelaia sp. TaxID=2233777 RepID=UPI0012386158|nr:4-hydroxy-tetrahydrodipicolinate reductase [Candidatus Tokpelaia sp.]KAA6405189.1 4-hydroxy-tetrahydrodipicolinate reductase [Candidatus Tokpelaia sp.]
MYIALAGAGGRMGRELIRAVSEHKNTILAGAQARQGSAAIGRDAGEFAGIGAVGVIITAAAGQAFAKAQAIVDFTAPEASLICADYAAQHGLIHIIGTTGFSPEQEKHIRRCAEKTVIVKSGNMSLGVNLLAALVQKAAKALSTDFDIEILEMHHRDKRDAPSGTALLLAQAAAKGRATDLQKHSIHSRNGFTGARPAGAIGFAALRGGTIVGEHSVIFAGPGEHLTLSHTAERRDIFAAGAIAAALWAKNKPHGLYSMRDVLELAE